MVARRGDSLSPPIVRTSSTSWAGMAVDGVSLCRDDVIKRSAFFRCLSTLMSLAF